MSTETTTHAVVAFDTEGVEVIGVNGPFADRRAAELFCEQNEALIASEWEIEVGSPDWIDHICPVTGRLLVDPDSGQCFFEIHLLQST